MVASVYCVLINDLVDGVDGGWLDMSPETIASAFNSRDDDVMQQPVEQCGGTEDLTFCQPAISLGC